MKKVLPLLVMLLIIVVCQGCGDNLDKSVATYFYLSDDFTVDSVDGKFFKSADNSLKYNVDGVDVNGTNSEKKEIENISKELEEAVKIELRGTNIVTNTTYLLGDAVIKSGDIDYGQRLVIEFDIEIEEKVSGRIIDGIYSFTIVFSEDATPPAEELDFHLSDDLTIDSIDGKIFTSDNTFLNYNVDGINPVDKDNVTIVTELNSAISALLDIKSVATNTVYTLDEAVLSGDIATDEKLIIKFDISIESITNDSKKAGTYIFTIAFKEVIIPWNGIDKVEPLIDHLNNYLIRTPANLAWLADLSKVDKNVLFLSDIDMGNKPFGGIKEFAGVFDGNNKSIKNINISVNGDTNSDISTALIQSVTGESIIKNLDLDGGSINGNTYIGSFVGKVQVVDDISRISNAVQHKFTIDNSTSNLDLTSNISTLDSSHEVVIGGFVAMINDCAITIRSSTYSGNIISNSNLDATIGGVIGKIENSYIVMYMLVNLNNISVNIESTGTNIIGGILGESITLGRDVYNIYGTELVNKGDLVNNRNSNGIVGGLIGVNRGNSNGNSILGIVYSKNEGIISGVNNLGGVIGLNLNASLTILGTSNKCLINGMVEIENSVILGYAGGIIGNNNGVGSVNILDTYNTGDITGSFMYAGGIIGKNITFERTEIVDSYNSGAITGSRYTGGIIGENNIDAVINMTGVYNRGSIVTFNNNEDDVYVGGLIGANIAVGMELTRSYNTGKLMVKNDILDTPLTLAIGGLIGRSLGATKISNAYNIGDIYTDSSASLVLIGGIIGFSSSLSIDESYNSGDVISRSDNASIFTITENYTGGIVGSIVNKNTANRNSLVNVMNSYNTGDIDIKGVAGGVVGHKNYEGANNNKLEVSHSFNYGDVKADINAGAIIGDIDEPTTTATYINNYWYALTTPVSDINQVGGKRLEVDEFNIAESFIGWRVGEEDSKWEILDGAKYPTLVNNKEISEPLTVINK